MKKENEGISSIYKDIFASVILCILGLLMVITSFSFRQLTTALIGPRFFPQVIGILLVSINSLFIFIKIRTLILFQEGKIITNITHQEVDKKGEKLNINNLLLTVVLITGAILLLEYFGFIISSCVYLFFQFIVLAPRGKINYILFAIIAIVSTFLVYFLFVNGFNLILPRGRIW